METYEEMLSSAYGKIKQTTSTGERFEIPKVEGHFEGKKTIWTNFAQITSILRRTSEHFQKFMLRELATQGHKDGDRLIINNKVPREKINQKIEEYANEFVICKECKKPDTQLVREDRVTFIHCLACGAKHTVRSKI